MDTSILRQLWSLIETTQASILITLDDTSLVQWLIQQLNEKQSLNPEQTDITSGYIHSRRLLIREIAQARLATQNL